MKKYKVLIKDVTSRVVQEELRELSDDIVERFLDEDGCVYMRRWYKNGEPIQAFVTKEIWSDDFNKQGISIMLDSNLSEKEKDEKLEKHMLKAIKSKKKYK